MEQKHDPINRSNFENENAKAEENLVKDLFKST